MKSMVLYYKSTYVNIISISLLILFITIIISIKIFLKIVYIIIWLSLYVYGPLPAVL